MLTRINLSTHSLVPTSQKTWNEKDVMWGRVKSLADIEL